MKLFLYLGDNSIPYREVMAQHSDFHINEQLIPKSRLVIAEQTHSSHVHVCSEADGGAGFDRHEQIADTDALITDVPGLFLLSRTADCTPVLLHDSICGAVAAVHSGRVGTQKNIVGATIQAMQRSYGSLPQYIYAWVGAHICHDHYEVDDGTWRQYVESCAKNKLDNSIHSYPYLDIGGTIVRQLWQAGLQAGNIESTTVCTYESPLHYSYRRNGTTNRQINVIGLIDG